MVRYGEVWYGNWYAMVTSMAWYEVWCNMVWYGIVSYGVVYYGMV
jgi:hypothetical protein